RRLREPLRAAGRGDARRSGNDVSRLPRPDRVHHLEMHRGPAMRRRTLCCTLVALALACASFLAQSPAPSANQVPPSPAGSAGRGRGQRGQQPPQSPRAIAPKDFTGYWVSVVTEDWRWRMVTPAKGDYDSVPLNAAGRRQADAWDPERDTAGGEACRAYGRPALMRVPGRIPVTWAGGAPLGIS